MTSAAERLRDGRFALTVAFVAAQFMNVLDTTIVNVALPSIDREFHSPASAAGLTVVAYLTMLVVVMPVSGWLGDRFGTRRIFLLSLASFTAASALCGLTHNLPELVAARALQGAGGGALLPSGMTMLYRAYTPTERLRLARLITIPTSFGPVLGPTLGGVLVQELSWRWVFWVNLPVGVAVMVLSWLLLKEHVEGTRSGIDLPGFILSALGIGLLVYGLAQGPDNGWGSPQIVLCLGTGTVLCLALALVELRSSDPLLRLKLLGIRGYRHALGITGLCGAAFTGVLFLVPLMLQLGDGYSPIQSGTSTFAEALGVAAASQIVSRVHARFGERQLQLGGFTILAALILVFAVAGRGMNLWIVRAMMFGIGLGSGTVQLLNQALAFDGISSGDTGHASGLYNTSRRLGAAVGVALLGSMLGSSDAAHAGARSDFSGAFVAAAGLAALGLMIAFRSWRTGAGLKLDTRARSDMVAAEEP